MNDLIYILLNYNFNKKCLYLDRTFSVKDWVTFNKFTTNHFLKIVEI